MEIKTPKGRRSLANTYRRRRRCLSFIVRNGLASQKPSKVAPIENMNRPLDTHTVSARPGYSPGSVGFRGKLKLRSMNSTGYLELIILVKSTVSINAPRASSRSPNFAFPSIFGRSNSITFPHFGQTEPTWSLRSVPQSEHLTRAIPR